MISAHIIGGPEVVRELQQVTPKVNQILEGNMGRALLRLLREVKQAKLTGDPLHVRTGRLRRSIHSEQRWADPSTLKGTVGTDVVYARPHEFGFEGTVGVKAHLRTIKQAFGRAIMPKEISIKAHSRHMHLPERSFLRSALKELEDTLTADLKKGLGDGL